MDVADPLPSIDTNRFVTVSGPPGRGVTSLSTRPASAIDCPVVSAGDIFREFAPERDMTPTQLSVRAENTDEIDRALD